VKFDFLGARDADHPGARQGLHRRASHGQRDFCFETLPLDDAAIYQLFADGSTESVFQFRKRGMRGMLRDARRRGSRT
jgi:DNA polymerase-3 subunit alpha